MVKRRENKAKRGIELDLGGNRRVQAVETRIGVYYAISTDGGKTWWGHGTNIGETLDQFVARYNVQGEPS
jgi:hypothetical protein